VAELALNDDQRHPPRASSTACACRSWCGTKRRRTPARTAVLRICARAAALDQCRPRVGPLMTHNNGPTGSSSRTSSQGWSSAQPQASMPDLASAAALAAADEQRAAALVKIGLGERECFLDAQPGSPQDHNQRA
jgi:hypothetical protein